MGVNFYPVTKVFIDTLDRFIVMRYVEPKKASRQVYDEVGNSLTNLVSENLYEYEKKLPPQVEEGVAISGAYDEYYAMTGMDIDTAVHILQGRIPFLGLLLKDNIVDREAILLDKLENEITDKGKEYIMRIHTNGMISELKDVLVIRDVIEDAMTICFNMGMAEKYTQAERYNAFVTLHPFINEFVLQTGYGMTAAEDGHMDYNRLLQLVKKYEEPQTQEETRRLIAAIQDSKEQVSLAEYYRIQRPADFVLLEFWQMLLRGYMVKTCERCGKYFTLRDKRVRKYCDRKDEAGHPCSFYGGKTKYKAGIRKDDYLVKYEQIRTLVGERYVRGSVKLPEQLTDKDLNEEQYVQWKAIGKKARKDYVNGKISGEALLKAIDPSILY